MRMDYQRNHRKAGRLRSRRGFTLLEVLLVLAVFVVIAGMAAPAVSGLFSGQQLRSAADLVRARFYDARVQAIKTGEVYGFFYMPGGSEYWVAPISTGFSSIVSASSLPVKQDQLDHQIVFAAGETMQDSRSTFESEQIDPQFSTWRPVLFYPDGTTQDATIVLQSVNGTEIQVRLRGLTGVASKSRLTDGEESNR